MSSSTQTQRASSRRAPALAVIGCGAIARAFHLRALARDSGVRERLVLVDPDVERARSLAREFGVSRVAANHREVLSEVDGAIVLTPHRLHASMVRDALAAGRPVLCEKPLGESSAEVRDLIAESERVGVPILVNNTRRLIPACRKVAELIRSGAIGEPLSMEFEEGDRFDWPAASGAMFGRQGGGKGILLDIGAHVLDLACWWLGGRPTVAAYADDSLGGSEAVARVELQRGACRVTVHLSWLSKLRNRYLIRGDAGMLEGGIYDWNELTLATGGSRRRTVAAQPRIRKYSELAQPLVDNFISVIRNGSTPTVSAADVLGSIELIEECYTRRTLLPMPWHDTLHRTLPAHV